jgi:hypothetical protein
LDEPRTDVLEAVHRVQLDAEPLLALPERLICPFQFSGSFPNALLQPRHLTIDRKATFLLRTVAGAYTHPMTSFRHLTG